MDAPENYQPKLETEAQIDELLQQHKVQKPKGNPTSGTQQKPSQEKAEAPSKKAGAIAKASQALDTKLAETAQTLVEADKKQQQALLAMGYREAKSDAQVVQKGYQIGMMTGLTRLKAVNTQSLSEQLEMLREHTDAMNADDVWASVENMVGDANSLSGLDDLLGELEELTGMGSENVGKEGLKILGKG